MAGRVGCARDEGSREKPAYLAIRFDELEVRGTTVSLDSARVVEANPVVTT